MNDMCIVNDKKGFKKLPQSFLYPYTYRHRLRALYGEYMCSVLNFAQFFWEISRQVPTIRGVSGTCTSAICMSAWATCDKPTFTLRPTSLHLPKATYSLSLCEWTQVADRHFLIGLAGLYLTTASV